MLETIRWHGAGSFAILNGTHIYINPRKIVRPERPADVILISSGQYDHCSQADIDKLRGDDTRIIASPSAANMIAADVVLRPYQSTSTARACIKAMPIYRATGLPDESGDLGFVISTSKYDVYYTGRTNALPDAKTLHADIVIMPISGENTPSHDSAAAALRDMRARWVVPYGWSGVGRAVRAEAQSFATLLDPSVEVLVLEPNP